ncbi:MAG: peptidase, partial [Pseudomonadota bacterium]
YHLLAARNDDRIPEILAETVVVIDPVQNPDGRDRFIHRFEIAEGLEPSGDRISAEQNEPWPSGRTNHYLFDMNRDWFMRTQPETRGRADAILEFLPVAFVDSHEMTSDNTYYFSPEAEPFNPHLAQDQRDSLQLFGRTNAGWFDRFGIDYFTREVYDALYPGYGASWPSYFGSIAMTYEQGSTRGLRYRQYDGVTVEYRETIRNNLVTSLGTAETVARNREKFLEDFYAYQVSAIDEGRRESIRSYIVPTQADQPGANKLAGLLVQQGVEVQRADAPFAACGVSYGPGSYIINLDQPAKRLIRTLMDADVPIDAEFLAEQERRRAKALGDQLYDVTAWSMPLMMGVTANACNRAVRGSYPAAGPELVVPGTVDGGTADVAYLVPWGTGAAVRFLAHAYRQGLTVKSSDLPFTNNGRRYPGGTLILDVADNPADVGARVLAIARDTGADVVAVDDSWVTDGPNFGSNNVVRHNAPRVAMAWDEPTSTYIAGNTRFVIERQFDYAVTAIRTEDLDTDRLAAYQVLILPGGGNYVDALGSSGIEQLRRWVDAGGVLIGIERAVRFLADPDTGFLSVQREYAVPEVDEREGNDAVDDATVEGSYLDDESFAAATAPLFESPDTVDGVLVKALVDTEHWLGAGVAGELNVLVRGADIYTPIRIDDGVNVARFAAADELLKSGYLWEQNRKQLAFKPFAVVQEHGRGMVIGFTQDPNVRAYLDGLNVIFMNAIFRGAAHARPLR